MKKSKLARLLSLSFVLILPILLSGCLKKNTGPSYTMELEIWGVFDDSDLFGEIIKNYRNSNPQISRINYKKLSANSLEYEKELVDAFASGKSPDIIFFQNNWLTKHQDKIAPDPNSTNNLANFKNSFIDAAAEDFIQNNVIYGMPLHHDSLALYYNKDLLNQAGITSPPTTWDEVVEDAKKITKIDQYGNISQSAIALGRSRDPGGINRSSDILMLMMLQSGIMMNEPVKNTAAFNKVSGGTVSSPGEKTLTFYTDFARASSPSYTWNYKMDYSYDSFRFGKTAMMLNYSYIYPRLKKTDPKLNFSIAPAPQFSQNKVNYGIYWGLAVAKNKQLSENSKYDNETRIREAWKFIRYATLPPAGENKFDPGKSYFELSLKPPARRDLIEKNKNHPVLGVFIEQALTAKSWLQPDDLATEEIFVQMIDDVVSGKATASQALNTATERFDELVGRKLR